MTLLKESSQTYEMILTNESTEEADGSTNFLVISFYFSFCPSVSLFTYRMLV